MDASRAMPHLLRAIDSEAETPPELELIVGFDADLAGAAPGSRLHAFPTQFPRWNWCWGSGCRIRPLLGLTWENNLLAESHVR
ncbi:hypothetical protein [Streptomyces sp. NPDC048527]|uniref:hypothetical protein n=1 Tax=Streptomyces sp. NPDC048527 TaxID=3365568 RepID=UPI00371ECA3F